MTQAVERLPYKSEALSSNSDTAKTKLNTNKCLEVNLIFQVSHAAYRRR
jgi:hypothetical protein